MNQEQRDRGHGDDTGARERVVAERDAVMPRSFVAGGQGHRWFSIADVTGGPHKLLRNEDAVTRWDLLRILNAQCPS